MSRCSFYRFIPVWLGVGLHVVFVVSFDLLDLSKALSFDIRVLSVCAVVWWVFRVVFLGGFWICLRFRLVRVR